MNKKDLKIGFIGCGHMANAIIKGIINSGFCSCENVIASSKRVEFVEQKQKDLGIRIYCDNKIVAKESNIIILATKPNIIGEVLEEIKEFLSEDKLIISIAAGVSTKKIENFISKKIAVIRVMPNAPAMLLEGMSGISKGEFASEEQIKLAENIFSKIGKTIIVDENKIDIVTAISGSGPAFFYKTINEIARAGEKLGLEYEKALLLSIQTAIGSAKIMMEGKTSPEELIDKIATKGGCTQVGVDYMNKANSEEMFFNTISKTALKAQQLGK